MAVHPTETTVVAVHVPMELRVTTAMTDITVIALGLLTLTLTTLCALSVSQQ